MMLICCSKIIQTLPTPSAILDLHFAPTHRSTSLFGVATSTGSVDLYQLTDARGEPLHDALDANIVPVLRHTKTYQYFPEDVLVTAFSWHPNGSAIGMSLSNGEISLGTVSQDVSAAEICTHELEAWTLAFLPDGSGVFSGGDDSVLNFRELPVNLEASLDPEVEPVHAEVRRLPWTDRRIHGAGVTAILPLKANNEGTLVLTGSYDDHIRLIDAPLAGRRKVLAETNLGGGVWRLKRLDTESQDPDNMLLLVSCMHAGTRIVKLARDDNEEWQFEVLAKFEEHKSMNYGSDCQPHVTENGQRTFITTSFYDRLLCLWRY